jgi:hypothetical protein
MSAFHSDRGGSSKQHERKRKARPVPGAADDDDDAGMREAGRALASVFRPKEHQGWRDEMGPRLRAAMVEEWFPQFAYLPRQ